MPDTFHKLTINVESGLNASLQSGDMAYKVTQQTFTSSNGISYSENSPVPLGEISKVENNHLYIKNMISIFAPVAGDLIMFAKNNVVNKSGIKGYFAQITLENNHQKEVELFSIASEISPSSK